MHYLCSMFKYNVQKYIEENHLIQPKDKVLVALSGGADSVALFRVLLSLGYSLECAHCNFHLRGEESDRDETFVRLLCDKYSIPLHVVHFDTEAYAKEKHLSIEMAARELRYDWFEKMRISDEKRKEIFSNTNYIKWLEGFTTKYESFADDSWLYTPTELSQEENASSSIVVTPSPLLRCFISSSPFNTTSPLLW